MRILFVCDDNRMASPMAAAFLYHEVRNRSLDVHVASAGFLSDGEPVDENVVRLLADRGVDLGAKRSRRATASLLAPADLILTMTSTQAEALRSAHPDHAARIGPLRSACAGSQADLTPRAWLAEVQERIGAAASIDGAVHDIAAPSSHGFGATLNLADQLLVAVQALVGAMAGSPASSAVVPR